MRKVFRTRVCKKCGREFGQRRIDKYAGTYCSRACSDSAQKVPLAQPQIEKTCPHCLKQFLCPAWRPHVKHCSIKCSKRAAALTRQGKNHPLWKEKPSMMCEVCGAVRMVYPSRVARFRACSRRCASILSKIAMPRVSSLESRMAEAFKGIGLSPIPQFTISYYIVDFAFPDEKLAVECDGSYWHGRPEQKVKDERKDSFLNKRGWRVLRIGENDIKASPEACAKLVQEYLSSSAHTGLCPKPANSERPQSHSNQACLTSNIHT